MDASEAHRLFQKHGRALIDVLQLEKWKVTFFALSPAQGHPSGKTVAGSCDCQLGYMTAEIKIDPAEVDSEAEFVAILRHELLHLFHAELRPLLDALEALIKPRAARSLEPLIELHREQIVWRIERLLDYGLGFSTATGMLEYAADLEEVDDKPAPTAEPAAVEPAAAAGSPT